MSQTPQTNKPQRTGIIPGKRRGGQPGNANALKPVNALYRDVSARIRDLKRRIRAAIHQADPAATRQREP